ncbi:MAG: hypothetical protein HRT52_13990 [Colwellia sp.]|nr:hypothetical protein [Colwellia sp.]
MLRKLSKLTMKSLLILSCGQAAATTVNTAYTDFPLRVNDGLSIDTKGNIYASNVGDTLNPQYTEFSGTGLIKIAANGNISVLSEEMQGPLGNAVDRMGNIYVANINDQTIKKVSPDGITTTFAQLDVYPAGVAIDNDNNLFVASYNSNNITKITASGEVSLFSDDEQLNGPVGIVFDAMGTLYTANYNNGNIYSISAEGVATFLAHIEGPDFFNIGYITYASGNIYASGIGSHQLYRVTLEGVVTSIAGTGDPGLDDGAAETATFACPNGITANPYGDMLYWNEYCGGGVNGNGLIRSLRIQPVVSTVIDGFEIAANDGVSVAPDGTVYISNVGNTLNPQYTEFDGTSIIKVNTDGTHSILTDQLAGPLGNAVDSHGNVIVANVNDMSIKSVASDGTVTTVASLDVVPAGIAIDSADNIFVASYNANQILRINTSGEVSLFSEDPLLNGPVGIVFDENGLLHVGNYNNGDIFTISNSGELTLLAHIDGPEYFTIGYITYASGYVYASGIGGHQIYRISREGDVLALAGTGEGGLTNGDGDQAKFACPNGIAALTTGNELFITDYCSPNQLRKISLATAAMPLYSNSFAQADQFDVIENRATTNDVFANDDIVDLDISALNLTIVVPANHGILTVHGAQGITYIPDTDYTGVDSYSYSYTGANGKSTQAVKVALNVSTAPAAAVEMAVVSKSSSGGTSGFGSIIMLMGILLLGRFKSRKIKK